MVKWMGVQVQGLIFLLMCKEWFIVLIFLYVNKDVCDQYEICIYKWLVDIVEFMDKIVDVFMKLDLVVGVDVQISLG